MAATCSAISAAAFLVLIAWMPLGLGFSPSILWSPHINGVKEMVEYRTLSPRELANYAMNKGGWSEYLCSKAESEETVNFVFLFVGKELQSLDGQRSMESDQAIVHFLKDAFSNSSSSLAFPYVTPGSEEEAVENALISEFKNGCQHNFGLGSFTSVGSCHVDGEKFNKLQDIDAVRDYVNSRMKRASGQTDLVMLCNNGVDVGQHSESSILSQLVGSLAELGAKYSILYVSDPLKPTVSHHGLERFLAEGATANISSTSTALCDAVCQIKSSLLEGILVGVVLLLILISGLCCMMGIDTPTRFETPQDS